MMHDRVLVKRKSAESVTKGGIVLPGGGEKEMPDEGLVVDVGPGHHLQGGMFLATAVKKGDKIIFSKYVGCEIEVKDEKLTVIRESDILLVL